MIDLFQLSSGDIIYIEDYLSEHPETFWVININSFGGLERCYQAVYKDGKRDWAAGTKVTRRELNWYKVSDTEFVLIPKDKEYKPNEARQLSLHIRERHQTIVIKIADGPNAADCNRTFQLRKQLTNIKIPPREVSLAMGNHCPALDTELTEFHCPICNKDFLYDEHHDHTIETFIDGEKVSIEMQCNKYDH